MFSGRFVHKNIIESSPFKNELSAGWIFHYLIGASVALTYPLFYFAFKVPVPANHLIPSLLWGLATTLLPWFTNFPAFGWGFFGIRAPRGTRPLIAPMISHVLYGLGLGMVLTIAL
jgi:hypothetical protein